MDGVKLLTDPVLRPRVMHLRRVGKVDMRAVRGVDAVLLSHLHFDHLDLPSLERLGRELPLVVPRGGGGLLRRRGFRAVTEIGTDEQLAIGALTIRATPALHDASRMPFGVRAEPHGYVVSGSRSVYFAGDTDLFEGMAELGPVDVALLPIWGWGSTLGSGGHMDPAGAVEASKRVGAAIVVPIHWGTYFPIQSGLRGAPPYVAAPAEEFAARMRADAPEIDVRVLEPGSSVAL